MFMDGTENDLDSSALQNYVDFYPVLKKKPRRK